MTKEINNIVTAFKEAQIQGRQAALASVVHVEGSSYRRPGARMLVEENGKMTGAISGGCLEGDALKKALLAIHQRQNRLVTYDTLHDDDIEVGVQLGCNGIVHILFEPIDPGHFNNPIAILEHCMLQEEDVVVATLFSLKNYHGYQPGTCLFLKGEQLNSNLANKELEARIIRDAETVLMNKTSVLQSYEDENLLAFVELIKPSIRLFIVGAGNDASPLVEIASAIGWKTIIIDGRLTHANKQRFPKADQIIVGDPLGAIKQCDIDERSFFVLMTHNYNYDLAILKLLLNENCAYIGTLGPRKRLQRMLADVRATGINIAEHQLSRIHGPTGLDIGAETAEEIALSVLGEIMAVERGRDGSFLKEREDFIHAREESAGELSKMHRE